jgi:hypothetical protein
MAISEPDSSSFNAEKGPIRARIGVSLFLVSHDPVVAPPRAEIGMARSEQDISECTRIGKSAQAGACFDPRRYSSLKEWGLIWCIILAKEEAYVPGAYRCNAGDFNISGRSRTESL